MGDEWIKNTVSIENREWTNRKDLLMENIEIIKYKKHCFIKKQCFFKKNMLWFNQKCERDDIMKPYVAKKMPLEYKIDKEMLRLISEANVKYG